MTTYDWIKQLPPALMQLDDIPLFGAAPPFPWDNLAKELASLFQLSSLGIQPIDMQWRTADKLLSGLGSNPVSIYFHFTPLEGSLCWVMDKNDITTLMQHLLTKNPQAFSTVDPDFVNGFYQFLTAQSIQVLNKLEFDKNLSPSVTDETAIPHQDSLCIDVKIALPDTTVTGRAIIPPDLRQSWKERYADRTLAPDYNSSLGQKIQVIVHLEMGRTELAKEEWQALTAGDFILLDSCSYEPDSDKGRVMMTVNGTPMFRARLKQGNIKILEFPFYHETEAAMNNDEGEDFEESEIEADFDEETIEGEIGEETMAEAPAKKIPGEELEKASPAPTTATSEKKETLSIGDLPITVVIEVGRIQMSVQKLMELQPGNTLELDLHPENGVDLVVNGRRVGKGELLKLGETLGVRVLDIG